MNGAEARSCVHMLLGLWPSPLLSQDEMLALTTQLASFERNEFDEALKLLSQQANPFRPSPVEVLKVLRSTHRRRLEALPALPPADPPDLGTSLSWLDQARTTLSRTLPWHGTTHAQRLPPA